MRSGEDITRKDLEKLSESMSPENRIEYCDSCGKEKPKSFPEHSDQLPTPTWVESPLWGWAALPLETEEIGDCWAEHRDGTLYCFECFEMATDERKIAD